MAAERQDFFRWMNPDPDFNKEEFISGYVNELELGSYRFVDLFKDIRAYIENDQDLIGIARALQFLPRLFDQLILQNIPFLKSDKQLIITWLCQRIKNEIDDNTFCAGLDEVIDAIRVISKSEGFTGENAVEVITSIFALAAKMDYKDLKGSTRVNILSLSQDLFLRYESRFSSRPGVAEFVTGLTDLARFEKTPSCLGILFPMFAQVSKAWASDLQTKVLAEKVFTSFYKYFPIDVQRSFSQDPGVPTLGELASGLEECITQPIYADFAFENLLENLDAVQGSDNKKKTLSMILSCVSSLDIVIVQRWQIKLWNCLKYEIWQGTDEEIIQIALNILTQCGKILATEKEDTMPSSLIDYINQISLECDGKTQDSMQWLLPNGRIFYALATSSLRALSYITKSTIPRMHVKWQDTPLSKEKGYLLLSLTQIVRAHANAYDAPLVKKQEVFSVLQACHNQVNSMYDEALQIASEPWTDTKASGVPELYLNPAKNEDLLIKTAVEGLALLVDIPGFYEVSAKEHIVDVIINVHRVTTHKDTSLQCISVLQNLAANNPGLFANNIIKGLFGGISPEIPDQAENEYSDKLNDAIAILETVVEIGCTEVCHTEYTVPGPYETASSYWYRNFEALANTLLLKWQEVLSLGQYHYANALLLTLADAFVRFEDCLVTAKASPNIIEPKARDPEQSPYTWIVMELYKQLRPEQTRHPHWRHTTMIQWYTHLREFPNITERQLDRLVQSVGEITLLALRSKSTTNENNFLLRWNNDRENHSCSALSSLFAEENEECDYLMMDEWQPDVRRGPRERCLANVLAMYMIAGTRPQNVGNLRIVFTDALKHMMKGYIGFDIQCNAAFRDGNFDCSPLASQSMLWYIQLLVNKFDVAGDGDEEDTPFDILGRYLAEARSVTATVPMSADRRERVLQVLAHFTAAALAAFDLKTVKECFRLMTDCLQDPAPFGLMAARLFRIMLAPSEILTRENFCKIRSVAPGWVLENIVLSLKVHWKSAKDPGIKANYLVALAGLLRFINPKEYIADQGEELLPAILEGTNIQSDAPSKLIYLEAINMFIQHDKEAVEQHLHTVIRGLASRLHNTLDDPSDSPVKCRMAAVNILKTLMTTYGKDRLMIYRGAIESEIIMACEDCAPGVRRKGQEASTLWGVWLSTEK